MVRSLVICSQQLAVVRRRNTVAVGLFLALLTWLWLLATPALVQAQDAEAGPSTTKNTSSDAAPKDAAQAFAQLNLKLMEEQVKKTLAKVMPAVVGVSGGGSGVVISQDGYVLTVAHVGNRAGRRVRVTFPDGRTASGRTLGNDHGVDAGLIKLTDEGPFPHAEMGVSGDLQAGQWCMALGYPLSFERGKPPAVRIGRVLSRRGTSVITDCTIMGGDSGGPLFDMNGNVIGISSRCDNRLTVNIHVPSDCFSDAWDRLTSGEDYNSTSPGDPYLGIAADENAEDARIGEVFPRTGARAPASKRATWL